jgi:hypothetical protein
VAREFDRPLDLVIDDASHLYEATKASFEILFPLIEPGGLYIIEDWAWAHWREFKSPTHPWASEVPLTTLVCQLVEVAGSSPAAVGNVTVYEGFTVIERGPGKLETQGFQIENHIERCAKLRDGHCSGGLDEAREAFRCLWSAPIQTGESCNVGTGNTSGSS